MMQHPTVQQRDFSAALPPSSEMAGERDVDTSLSGSGAPPVDRILRSLDALSHRIHHFSETNPSVSASSSQQSFSVPGAQTTPKDWKLQRAIAEITQKRDRLNRLAESGPDVTGETASGERVTTRPDAPLADASDRAVNRQQLDAVYDEIVGRLDRIHAVIDNPQIAFDLIQRLSEIRSLLADLPSTERLDALAGRLDLLAGQAGQDHDFQALDARIAAIAEAIVQLPGYDLVHTIERGLADVARSIAELERQFGDFRAWRDHASQTEVLLSQLTQRADQIPRIAHEMERQSATLEALRRVQTIGFSEKTWEGEAILQRLDALSETIGRLYRIGTPLGDHGIGRLHHGLESLAEALEKSVLAQVGAAPDMSAELVDALARIEALLRKTDTVGPVATDGAAWERLERQIADLTVRIEAVPKENLGLTDALARFELTLSQALDSSGIAERAAAAAAEMVVERDRHHEIEALKREIQALQNELRTGVSRDRNLLIAIAEAVENLAAREENRSGEAGFTPAPAQPSPLGPGKTPFENEARRYDPPLAPGSLKPHRHPPEVRLDDPSLVKEERADAVKADFIAAARRSVQTAAERKAAAGPANGNAAPPLTRKPRFYGIRLPYKRQLLSAAALSIVVAGSGYFGWRLLSGLAPPPTEVSLADKPPATAIPTSVTEQHEDSLSSAFDKEDFKAISPEPMGTGASFGQETRMPPADRFASPDNSQLTTASLPKRASPAGPGEIEALSKDAGLRALRQAAISGNPKAQAELAARLAEGRGLARDLEGALRWYHMAADAGFAPAQYRLGSLYEKGQGVPKDIKTAAEWYRRAAEAGNAKAMHNLAVIKTEAQGGAIDYRSAAAWFEKAAKLGVRDSQYNLGVLYAKGLGVPRDMAQSYTWFSIAAKDGDAGAAAKRDEIAASLDRQALVHARLDVEAFTPETPTPEANDVILDHAHGGVAPEYTAALPPGGASRIPSGQ